jgi:hypothetical protein
MTLTATAPIAGMEHTKLNSIMEYQRHGEPIATGSLRFWRRIKLRFSNPSLLYSGQPIIARA